MFVLVLVFLCESRNIELIFGTAETALRIASKQHTNVAIILNQHSIGYLCLCNWYLCSKQMLWFNLMSGKHVHVWCIVCWRACVLHVLIVPKGKSRGISGISALFSKTQSLIPNGIPKIPLGFWWEMMCFWQITHIVDDIMIETNNQDKQQAY